MTSIRPILGVSLALCLFASIASAQTEEAVSFPQLVERAQHIFVGQVVAVDSFRADRRDGARIRTRVTFSVDEKLRGSGLVTMLEFLGGTVGDLTQEVADMPRFSIGERYVVFALDGDRWVNPLVGSSQGLLRVSRDARDGTARVLTAANAPLASVSAIGRPVTRVSSTMTTPMSLPAFLDAIRGEMARQR
jgi:hypothetical protein